MKYSNLTTCSSALVLLMTTGCGWVDSTGNQEVSGSAQVNPSLVFVGLGEAFVINENTQQTIVFGGTDNRLTNWNWTLLDGQANIQRCLDFDSFEQRNASNSLSQSCARNGSCEVKLEEVRIDNVTRFNITTPPLRSAAALEYLFRAQNTDGETIERRQLMCAASINDAPVAVDDNLSMQRGSALQIFSDDPRNLLANDMDDEDLRNADLQVNTTSITPPRFAADFQLYTDGGFYYEPRNDAPLSSGGSISDEFVYAVSDGTNTSTATVRIKITDFNSAPALNTDIPEVTATISDLNDDMEFFNLSLYFSDAENDPLNFKAFDETLPESGNLYLTRSGLLEGNPMGFDSGRYLVGISADDSIERIEANFYLNVVRSDGSNRKPFADDIKNNTVSEDFSYDVSEFFGDADEDHLAFTATGLPDDIEITTNGVIFGTSSSDNRGTSHIRVTADDGNGGSANDGFRLRIR